MRKPNIFIGLCIAATLAGIAMPVFASYTLSYNSSYNAFMNSPLFTAIPELGTSGSGLYFYCANPTNYSGTPDPTGYGYFNPDWLGTGYGFYTMTSLGSGWYFISAGAHANVDGVGFANSSITQNTSCGAVPGAGSVITLYNTPSTPITLTFNVPSSTATQPLVPFYNFIVQGSGGITTTDVYFTAVDYFYGNGQSGHYNTTSTGADLEQGVGVRMIRQYIDPSGLQATTSYESFASTVDTNESLPAAGWDATTTGFVWTQWLPAYNNPSSPGTSTFLYDYAPNTTENPATSGIVYHFIQNGGTPSGASQSPISESTTTYEGCPAPQAGIATDFTGNITSAWCVIENTFITPHDSSKQAVYDAYNNITGDPPFVFVYGVYSGITGGGAMIEVATSTDLGLTFHHVGVGNIVPTTTLSIINNTAYADMSGDPSYDAQIHHDLFTTEDTVMLLLFVGFVYFTVSRSRKTFH